MENGNQNEQTELPEWFELIQTSRPHYIKIYEKIQKRKDKKFNKSIFNWSAFIGGPFWALYRKMYGVAFAYIAITVILEYVLEISHYSSDKTSIMPVLFGFFGNSLYFDHLEKLYKKGFRSSFFQDTDRINLMAFLFLIVVGCAILFLIKPGALDTEKILGLILICLSLVTSAIALYTYLVDKRKSLNCR